MQSGLRAGRQQGDSTGGDLAGFGDGENLAHGQFKAGQHIAAAERVALFKRNRARPRVDLDRSRFRVNDPNQGCAGIKQLADLQAYIGGTRCWAK